MSFLKYLITILVEVPSAKESFSMIYLLYNLKNYIQEIKIKIKQVFLCLF